MKKAVVGVVLAGLWIMVSEFVRNELLFKHYWVDHYNRLGLSFETRPVNGVLWMVWSFLLAYLIRALGRKFSFRRTAALIWAAGFVMMWIVAYNLQVLPLGLLVIAVPLSLVEVMVAGLIIRAVDRPATGG